MKLFSQFIKDLKEKGASNDEIQDLILYTEKGMSNDEIQDLINRARSSAQGVVDDDEKSSAEKKRADEVIDWVNEVEQTFKDEKSLHPNSVNGLMRIVAGVGSGRYGRSNPPDGKVPANYKK